MTEPASPLPRIVIVSCSERDAEAICASAASVGCIEPDRSNGIDDAETRVRVRHAELAFVGTSDLVEEIRIAISRLAPAQVAIVTERPTVSLAVSARSAGAWDMIASPVLAARAARSIELFAKTRASAITDVRRQIDEIFFPGQVGASVYGPEIGEELGDRERQIIRTLLEHGEMSADQIGKSLGLSRVAARKYCEQLSASGLLSSRRARGDHGRPRKLYRMG